jgi:D-alanyl-D-alanine carboxypeptidase
VRSPSALVVDLDRGEVLWARDPDSPRTVASITKLFAALALASTSPDLDARHCVTWEQWPSRPGARSKFETGHCYTGWDFLGAALVSSDNRGAFALPSVAGEDYYTFVDRMNDVAADIGASSASFVDPAGLEDENVATARDVLKAVVAVSAHPELSIPASANGWTVEDERKIRQLVTTNRLDGRYDTLAAKTGYTDTARYCFATVVRTRSGRTLAAAVLGAPTNAARFADVRALVDWADER